MFGASASLKQRDSETAAKKGKYEGTGIVAPFRASRRSFAALRRDSKPYSWIAAIPAPCSKIRQPNRVTCARFWHLTGSSQTRVAYSKSDCTPLHQFDVGMISPARSRGRNVCDTQKPPPPIVGRHPKTRLLPEHSVARECPTATRDAGSTRTPPTVPIAGTACTRPGSILGVERGAVCRLPCTNKLFHMSNALCSCLLCRCVTMG